MSPTDDATGTADRSLNPFDGRIVPDTVDPDAFRATVKHLLAAAILVVLLGVLSLLPGLDRAVPRSPLTVFALVVATVTLLLVRRLVAAARHAEDVVRGALTGPTELRLTAGVVVKHLGVLVAVLVAYRGLAGVFVPLLAPSDTVWLYDLAFLLLALVPTAFVAYYLYGSLDASAAHFTRRVLGPDGTLPDEPTAVEDGDDGEVDDGDGTGDGDDGTVDDGESDAVRDDI